MRRSNHNTDRDGASGDFVTMRSLLPYLWPRDAFGLRVRVIISLVLLALAKITTVAVPVFLKYAVDALTIPANGEGVSAKTIAIAVPVGMLVAYGAARVLSLGFKELQGAVFAKVAERALRQAGVKTFEDGATEAVTAKSKNVIGNHAYAIESVDLVAKTVNLQNPWGIKHVVDLPVKDFKAWYTGVQIGK